jgi:hypothetical protein
MQRKKEHALWDATRHIMATIINFAGRSLKKGITKKPNELIRLPGDTRLKPPPKVDMKKLWEKEIKKNKTA